MTRPAPVRELTLETPQQFARWLADACDDIDLRRYQLARRAGVAGSTARRVIESRGGGNLATVLALVSALGYRIRIEKAPDTAIRTSHPQRRTP